MSGPQCSHCEQSQDHIRPHVNVPQDCLDEALEEIETLSRELLHAQGAMRAIVNLHEAAERYARVRDSGSTPL